MPRASSHPQPAPFAPTVLRLPDVLARTGRSRSSVLRDVEAGRFPKPVKLGQWSVGWLTAEVEKWLADRIAERDGRAA